MLQVIDPPICLCGTPEHFVGYTQKKEEVWHCPSCDRLDKVPLPTFTVTYSSGETVTSEP